jgi:hypothetical protein
VLIKRDDVLILFDANMWGGILAAFLQILAINYEKLGLIFGETSQFISQIEGTCL